MKPVCQFNRGYGINDEPDAPSPPPAQPLQPMMQVKMKMTILNSTQMKVTVTMVSRMRQGSIAKMNRSYLLKLSFSKVDGRRSMFGWTIRFNERCLQLECQ